MTYYLYNPSDKSVAIFNTESNEVVIHCGWTASLYELSSIEVLRKQYRRAKSEGLIPVSEEFAHSAIDLWEKEHTSKINKEMEEHAEVAS